MQAVGNEWRGKLVWVTVAYWDSDDLPTPMDTYIISLNSQSIHMRQMLLPAAFHRGEPSGLKRWNDYCQQPILVKMNLSGLAPEPILPATTMPNSGDHAKLKQKQLREEQYSMNSKNSSKSG